MSTFDSVELRTEMVTPSGDTDYKLCQWMNDNLVTKLVDYLKQFKFNFIRFSVRKQSPTCITEQLLLNNY